MCCTFCCIPYFILITISYGVSMAYCCFLSLFCVDEQAYVIMANGKRKKIAFLKIGDKIKTLNEKGQLINTPVIMFAHVGNQRVEFYNVTTESNKSIKLSATHLISLENDEFKFAKDVKTGDVVVTYDFENDAQVKEKVVSVNIEECHGFMAPITQAGTFLANGVLLSCYAEVNNQSWAHASMEPIRWWNSVENQLKSVLPERISNMVTIKKQPSGIHWYPTGLYLMAKPFVAMGSKENIITGELQDEQLDKTLFLVS